MAISVAQAPLVLAGAYSGSFGSNVSAGDTIFLVATGYTTSAVSISTSSPMFNGSTPAGSTKLIEAQSPGINSVYSAIWMLPNVAGGASSVSLTITNSQGQGSNAVGLVAYDVAGLGHNPTLDTSNTATGTTNHPSSGASGAIGHVPEFILAGLVGYGLVMSDVGAPWTEVQFPDGYNLTGYQIVTSSGGSYTYSQTGSSAANWVGGIVTVYAGAAASRSGLLMAALP